MWASSLATVQQKSKIHPLYLFVLRFFRKCVPGCAFVMSQWAPISSLIYLQGISLVRFHSVVGQKPAKQAEYQITFLKNCDEFLLGTE